MLRLSKKADYALMAMKHLAIRPDAASATPATALTFDSTSAGSDCAAGQPGAVSVIVTSTVFEASTPMS